jgi:hypothetical protein
MWQVYWKFCKYYLDHVAWGFLKRKMENFPHKEILWMITSSKEKEKKRKKKP